MRVCVRGVQPLRPLDGMSVYAWLTCGTIAVDVFASIILYSICDENIVVLQNCLSW